MTERGNGTMDEATLQNLHAYHDGELSGFQRWRFERTLRRSPELRAELEALTTMRDVLLEGEAAEPSPDLWDAIALRLPAVDAQRAAGTVEAAPATPAFLAPSWWLKPMGAVAATAAVALVAVYGGLFTEDPVSTGGVVRWIDSGERSVMVLDDDPDITIIWVLDSAVEGALRGGRRDEV